MKFNFEPNLQFQIDAIDAVTGLFEGAPFVRSEDRIFAEVIENRLALDPEKILENRSRIIESAGITEPFLTDEMDFSIEMETGTGKTYVYLRTALELHQKYGLCKFVIVVPSIAVREGVIQTLKDTREHFKTLYNTNYHFFEYSGKRPTDIKHYAESNTLEIMVMNIQAFNSDDRIINQDRDSTYGEKLINILKKTSPIIIMDEPQEGMDSENNRARIAAMNPLCKLRYSATHRECKNLIHQLTPFDAYNKKLVKTVEILSVHEDNKQSNITLSFEEAIFTEQAPKAKLRAQKRNAGGEFSEGVITVKQGTDLEVKTDNPAYHDWVVDRIWKDMTTRQSKIRFTNDTELTEGERHGWDKEAIFRNQIRLTIGQHFDKKERLKPLGIKVLSLFFIDRVANYVTEDGLIRTIFEEEYSSLFTNRYGKAPAAVADIHNGYFAKTGQGEYTESVASMGKNTDVFELIMQDKKRLLSFDEPLEFIFSHSALGVGWDNPNVFQICTLNETESIIKKRQEIGRGLRICVNQDGERVRDNEDDEVELTNVLTVIPNQSYHAFVEKYQGEMIEEYGELGKKHRPKDARKKPTKIKLIKDRFDSSDFDRLWQKISKKTQFEVHFSEDQLVEKCVEAVNGIKVPEHSIRIELNRITRMDHEADTIFEREYLGSDQATAASPTVAIDIADVIAKETWLSLETAAKIIESTAAQKQLLKNPMAFISETVKAIKKVLETEMVRLVRYNAIDEQWDKKLFQELIETYQNTVPTEKGIYDKVICDSTTIEEPFAIDANNEGQVRLYLKLPSWYEIDTPIGKYHPDWALVIEHIALENNQTGKHYFVVETKGKTDIDALTPDEKTKIECAIKHFEAIGLKEYLAPIDSLQTFKQEANRVTPQPIF